MYDGCMIEILWNIAKLFDIPPYHIYDLYPLKNFFRNLILKFANFIANHFEPPWVPCTIRTLENIFSEIWAGNFTIFYLPEIMAHETHQAGRIRFEFWRHADFIRAHIDLHIIINPRRLEVNTRKQNGIIPPCMSSSFRSCNQSSRSSRPFA